MFSHLLRSKSLRTLAGVSCLAITGAAGALLAQPSEPATPPAAQAEPAKPATVAKAQPAVSDVTLARAALAALDADPVLKDVNLIVSVVDRGAVVGGPVVSDEIKKRAEAVIRGVPGIESVKNVCFVQADPDPLLRAVAERMKPGARPATAAPLPGVALAPTAPEGFLPPVPPEPASDLVVAAKPNNTVVAQAPVLPPVSVLGGPVAPAGPGSVAKVSPLPTVAPTAPATPALPTAPAALTGAKPDVQGVATALRRTDARYARLTVEVKPDGGLYVSGWSAKPADAWDFATELRKLPGVARVAVDQARLK